ncbi:MAG: hypothetical protein KAJ01_09335 [Candidatus Hydrogenedentes bacterium]|nr:hypothetical protein [Candidatus Hydrogenedentota bacterium]
MSPQPIDVQTMIGQMAAADRAQQMAERQPLVQQERLAVQTPAQSTEKETQVQQADQTERAPVREARRHEPFAGRRRRRKKRDPKKPVEQEEGAPCDSPTYNPSAERKSLGSDEGQVLDMEA